MFEDKLLIWKVNRGNRNVLRGIYEKYKDDLVPGEWKEMGANMEERRQLLTKYNGIVVALAFQGGQYTQHELLLLQKNKIPIVALVSGGGAAGGKISYKEQIYDVDTNNSLLCSKNAGIDERVEEISDEIVRLVLEYF